MENHNVDSNKDEKGLVKAIRETSAREIEAVREKTKEEMERLQQIYASDIEELRKKSDDETDSRLEHELSKIKNRALIEKKKLKLRNIEDFVVAMTEEAVMDVRRGGKEKYKKFLMDAITESLLQIKGQDALVYISEEDAGLENLNEAVAQRTGHGLDIKITVDERVTQGGAIVADKDKGIYYNSTIERIVYRKYDQIRKGVVAILSEKNLV